MNKWGYQKKYQNIKESLRETDKRLEGLLKKKAQLIQAKERCAKTIREWKK